EQGLPRRLPPDQRLLFGRLGELEVDGQLLVVGQANDDPAVVAEPVVLEELEAQRLDVELERLVLARGVDLEQGYLLHFVLLGLVRTRDGAAVDEVPSL